MPGLGVGEEMGQKDVLIFTITIWKLYSMDGGGISSTYFSKLISS